MKFTITKKRPYDCEGTVRGEFLEEHLRLLNLPEDTTELKVYFEVSCQWDVDIPMPGIEGPILVETQEGWVEADDFAFITGIDSVILDSLDELLYSFDLDYVSDRAAAAAEGFEDR